MIYHPNIAYGGTHFIMIPIITSDVSNIIALFMWNSVLFGAHKMNWFHEMIVSHCGELLVHDIAG